MKFCRLPPAAEEKFYMQKNRVADSHHFNMDSDTAFHLNADTDPTFHFNADPDSALQSDANLRPLHFEPPRLHFERLWPSRPPRLHCEPLKLLNFDLSADRCVVPTVQSEICT
jgi:hypothetical protein